MVRRAAGLRGQRYRRDNGRLRGPAHRRTGRDAGVRLTVDVRRRRAADLRFRASRRRSAVVRRRRGCGRMRMRMRIRIRRLGRGIRHARFRPVEIARLRRRGMRRRRWWWLGVRVLGMRGLTVMRMRGRCRQCRRRAVAVRARQLRRRRRHRAAATVMAHRWQYVLRAHHLQTFQIM